MSDLLTPRETPVTGRRPLRVAYHVPFAHVLGAARWIYRGWQDGFEVLGHEFRVFTGRVPPFSDVRAYGPDLLFLDVCTLGLERDHTIRDLQILRSNGTKVLLWVHWPLEEAIDARVSRVLETEDVADVYYGERVAEQMVVFERDTGKRYHEVPHAASPRLHFPTAPVAKYAFDVVYLGANLAKKRWFAENVLMPLRRRYRVGLFGPGWTRSDRALWVCSAALRRARLGQLSRLVDAYRLSVPEEAENQLYSSAKIALNFHEREDDGSQPHYIINQRCFKIPACGGFQISDEVPAVRRYFTDGEVVMASLDPADWLEKVEFFLAHEEERRAIQQAGAARAQQEHLYNHRAQHIASLVGLEA